MPAREVEARIEGTAISPTGGRDDRFGAGIVDPYLALTAETTGPAGPPAGGVPDTAVRVVPVPRDQPLLGPRDAAATTAAAILLGAAAVATAAGVTVRRILARRHRGPGRRDGPVYRPVGPVPVDRLR
jgi:hypothetical protein